MSSPQNKESMCLPDQIYGPINTEHVSFRIGDCSKYDFKGTLNF